MDIVGHLLLGVSVSGELTPYTVAVSLLPDVGALPMQFGKSWKNPTAAQLKWYRLWHSPLALTAAFFLPGPGFIIYATHVVSDMVTHHFPYSDFPMSQWRYGSWWYTGALIVLGAIACLRLFY